jgi:hypothetical protein
VHEPAGFYAGTLTIGGLIDRSDIHRAMLDDPNLFGNVSVSTLDPDTLADTLWQLYQNRTEPEAVVNAMVA